MDDVVNNYDGKRKHSQQMVLGKLDENMQKNMVKPVSVTMHKT